MPASTSASNRASYAVKLFLLGSVLAAAVFLAFLGNAKIVTSHELRVARTAATMSRAGWPWAAMKVGVPLSTAVSAAAASQPTHRPSANAVNLSVNPWLVPVFEGQLRLQKPPLPYWCTAVMFRLFGEGDGVARFVPAALGLLSTALMYRLARRTMGRRVAWIAAAVWVSSHFIITEHRKAMVDPYLACMTLAAIVAWVEASRRRAGQAWMVLIFYIALAAGAMAKGPVVFLHAAGAIGAYAWAYRQWPQVRAWVHVAGVAVFLAIALPWPMYVASHVPHALEIWRFESVGEFTDNQRNARPVWYYVPQLFLITAPWTAFAIAGVVNFVRRPLRRRSLPIVWIGALLLVFSASHMKKNAYLLPLMPAFVLLVAGEINRLLAYARMRRGGERVWTFGHSLAAVIFAVVTTVASVLAKLPPAATISIGVFTLAVSTVPMRLSLRGKNATGWFVAQAVAFALLIAVFNDFPQAWRQNAKAVKVSAAATERSSPSANDGE